VEAETERQDLLPLRLPTASPANLQAAQLRLALGKFAHARLSRLAIDYDVVGAIADHLVTGAFRPIRDVAKAAQLESLRHKTLGLTELNWFHTGCSDVDVARLVDTLSPVNTDDGSEDSWMPTTALARLWLHGNPRITDASAAGLLRVATARDSNLVHIDLRETAMSADKTSQIAAAVSERARALQIERSVEQHARSLREGPARCEALMLWGGTAQCRFCPHFAVGCSHTE
jgi:hypothetical protein